MTVMSIFDGVGQNPQTSTKNFRPTQFTNRFTPTITIYLYSCFHPRSEDCVKVTYLFSQNPVSKVIGKTIQNAAICDEMVTNPSSNISCRSTKLYIIKYNTQSKTMFPPPQKPQRKSSGDTKFPKFGTIFSIFSQKKSIILVIICAKTCIIQKKTVTLQPQSAAQLLFSGLFTKRRCKGTKYF